MQSVQHYLARKKDARNKVLAQFELLPNYRFHRYVTGRSALEAAAEHGNGRVAAFVSAPGSAGTIAAGDEIKARFPDSLICALEPKECATLFNNGRGVHRIEGIGDKMVTVIHNVLTTDYVGLIHDQDCILGLELLERQGRVLERTLHLEEGQLAPLAGVFGISGICNVLGAIQFARLLNLGPEDNVVTVATDGFGRYLSVLAVLEARSGAVAETVLQGWFETVFRNYDPQTILDVRPHGYRDDATDGFAEATLLPDGVHDFAEQALVCEVLGLLAVAGALYDLAPEAVDLVGRHVAKVWVQRFIGFDLGAVDQECVGPGELIAVLVEVPEQGQAAVLERGGAVLILALKARDVVIHQLGS